MHRTPSNPLLFSFRVTVRWATLLTASLGLLLAGSGCGPASYHDIEPGDHVSLLFPPHGCEVGRSCKGLAVLRCQVEADGPYFYVETLTGRVVSGCGNACFDVEPKPDEGHCACPPKAWTCN